MLKLTSNDINDGVENEDGHRHIVYIRNKVEPSSILKTGDRKGHGIIGMTSKVNGHSHEVWVAPSRFVIDPKTGKPAIDPMTGSPQMTPETYYIGENSKNGHTHNIEMEYLQLNPVKRERIEHDNVGDDDESRVSDYLKVAIDSYSYDNLFYLDQAEKSEALYRGGDHQWPDEALSKLKARGAPALSFNLIKSKINSLTGIFGSRPTSPKCKPTETSDSGVVDIINTLNSHVLSRNNYPQLQREINSDQIIGGRGNLSIKLDTSVNPEGDILLTKSEWDQVTYMPHNKLDLSDCEGVCEWEWVSKDYLKMVVPDDKLDLIEGLEPSQNMITHINTVVPNIANFKFNDIQSKTYKLMTVTKKEYRKRTVIFNPDDKYYLDGSEGTLPSWLLDSKIKKEILTIPGFEKVERTITEYWVGKMVGDILFSDRLSELNGFSVIPCYATKRKHFVKGEVFDLQDAQFETNKRISTLVDCMGRFASIPVVYDSNTFDSDKQRRDYMNNRSKPGSALQVSNQDKPPKIEEAPRFPTELLSVTEYMGKMGDIISGFNSEGISGVRNAQSTPLYRERRQSALSSVDYIFSNFDVMQREMAFRLIEMYKAFYTPERVWRILENQNAKLLKEGAGGVMINGLPFQRVSYKYIKDIWDNCDIIRYDIAISYSDFNTTKAEDDLAMAISMANQGVPGVNGEWILEFMTDLTEEQRARLRAIANSEQNRQAQMASQAGQLELQKVQLGIQGQAQRQQAQIEVDKVNKMVDTKMSEDKIEIERMRVELERMKLAIENLKSPNNK